MRFFSVFIFILTFTLDVRVQASEELVIVETPNNCLQTNGYCVIKNMSQRYQYQGARFVVSLSPESIVIRQSQNHWSLVKGLVFVNSETKLTFDVPYGQIEVSKGTQVLLEQMEDKVIVQTLFGKSLLKPIGVKSPVLVAPGHENYISKVDESLKAQTGIPKPILVESLLKNWAYHTTSKKKDFLEEVEEFKTVHEKAVKDLSILNQQIISREISSVEEKRVANELRQKRQKEYKKRMQQTYYERLLQNPSDE